MKIDGFDKLSRQLNEAQKALGELDGEIGQVNYDPEDPASIEAAIVEMEALVDRRMGAYASNPVIAPLIENTKESLRTMIIDRAQAYRLGRKDD